MGQTRVHPHRTERDMQSLRPPAVVKSQCHDRPARAGFEGGGACMRREKHARDTPDSETIAITTDPQPLCVCLCPVFFAPCTAPMFPTISFRLSAGCC